MDKIKQFRNTVKVNRVLLKKCGYPKPTVDSWIYTTRVPEYDTACKLADILKVRLTDIPYYRSERVV